MLRLTITTRAFVVFLLPACLAASPGARSCQANTTYSGEAYGASVNVLGIIKTTISDTGPLPANGGSLSTQLLGIDLPSLLNLGLLTESTTGGSNRTSSQSSVANVTLTVAGIDITAAVLTSNATAQACGSASPSVAGGSNIAALTVNGRSITITGAPNQTVPLLVGALIINEQISSVTSSACGASANVTVNALHLTVADIADVVISSSQAGVNCNPPPQ
jgi:hypothetical protein